MILTTCSIAEMKDPKQYKKPIAASMGLLLVLYIVISLVVYRYCGGESGRIESADRVVFIASPALGSAGDLIKKITYGIAVPGLWISATLCQHVSSRANFSGRLFDTIARCQVHLCQDPP